MISIEHKVRFIGFAIIFLFVLFLYFYKKGMNIKRGVLLKLSNEQLISYRKIEKKKLNFDQLEFFLKVHSFDEHKTISKINLILKSILCSALIICFLYTL